MYVCMCVIIYVILNIILSFNHYYSYLDPVSCKCNILPLAVWAHRHRLKGLRCWIARKGVVALTSLLRTCKDKSKTSLQIQYDKLMAIYW